MKNNITWFNLINIIKGMFIESDQKVIDRLRLFKPTIEYNFWGKNIKWKERDKPLTNKELKGLYSVDEIYLKQ